MNGMCFNVKDYGAVGDGVCNDRPCIQAAFNAAFAAGGGWVFFPAGKYQCVVSGGGTAGVPTFAFFGITKGNLLISGEGRASHIVLAGPGVGDRRLFDIRDGCKYITFKNLKLSSELVTEDEHQHLICFNNSGTSTERETGRMEVIDCYFGHTRGDCISFLGEGINRVRNIVVKRCIFDLTSATHSRSAIQFQRSADDIIIESCWMGHGGSSIDFEPSSTGTNERVILTRNHFDATSGDTQLSGHQGYPHTQSILTYNTGRSFGALNLQNMVLCSNIIDNLAVGIGLGCIGFRERIYNATICDNLLYRSGDTGTPTVLALYYQSPNTGGYYQTVVGNMCVQDSNSPDGGAIKFQNTLDINVSDNLCIVNLSVNDKGYLILQESTTAPSGIIVCRGNLGIATNSRTRRGFVGGDTTTSVVDNLFRNVNAGVTLSGTSVQFAGRNVLQATAASLQLLTAAHLYAAIDGTGSPTGPTVYEVSATPESLIPAHVGSIALRSRGGGAGTTMYVKESSPTTTTGWVGK